MVIISKAPLNDFSAKHAAAQEPLSIWYHTVKLAEWKDFNELRQDFRDCDYIGNDRFVFNVRSYRIIAMIFFNKRTVFIRAILTHSEYDRLRNRLPTM